jgi:hypothetical protein
MSEALMSEALMSEALMSTAVLGDGEEIVVGVASAQRRTARLGRDRPADRGTGEGLGERLLATEISFINARGGRRHPGPGHRLRERIGRRFLSVGLGLGGGCLPKDIRAARARRRRGSRRTRHHR